MLTFHGCFDAHICLVGVSSQGNLDNHETHKTDGLNIVDNILKHMILDKQTGGTT